MKKLIVCHVSDTHGLPRKGVPERSDVIVHSGDLFPNKRPKDRSFERDYQRDWIQKIAHVWARWAGGRPVVLVNGNHDFIDPVPYMRRAGMRAYNVEGRVLDLLGFRFMGLPDIPIMGGRWNHERTEEEIADHFSLIMEREPDIVVAHCPPYGVLDDPYSKVNYHVGSTAIANHLTYCDRSPPLYLTGHCHERGGRREWLRGTLVSNAATSLNMVEIEK